MAIVTTKQNAASIINTTSKRLDENTGLNLRDTEKKTGFLKSTVNELTKVRWPGIKYVLAWSLIIILFTAFFSITLGFVDHFYQTSTVLGDCVSKVSLKQSNDTLSNCGENYFKSLTFRQ